MNEYYEKNREKCLRKIKDYQKTKIGRATKLMHNYRRKDKYYKKGEGDLTAKWIVDNIFTKPCIHCGETDWTKIGCNRLDNSKPHTMDNVEPCCWKCNYKLYREERKKKIYQYTFDEKLINVWNSASEAARELGFSQGNITMCCQGKRKIHKGYKWSYKPL